MCRDLRGDGYAMKKNRCLQVCVLVLSLFWVSGCANTVNVINEKEFHLMGRRLAMQLYKRGIFDAEGCYRKLLVNLESFPEPAGKLLHERLKPDFLIPSPGKQVRSFAVMMRPEDEVGFLNDGFVIQKDTETIAVRLIGGVDWNGDAETDWFVLCRVENPNGCRDYYVVITRIDTWPFTAEAIGTSRPEGDPPSFNAPRACEIPQESREKLPERKFTRLEEVEAGSKTVVLPPRAGARFSHSGLREKTLDK